MTASAASNLGGFCTSIFMPAVMEGLVWWTVHGLRGKPKAKSLRLEAAALSIEN
jgi:hypothetical protein